METKAVDPPLPVTEAGLRVMADGWPCGVTVMLELTEAPFSVAVIVTGVLAVTLLACTAAATCEPAAGTLTLAGTVIAGELLERLSVTPAAGARPLMEIVAWPCPPPLRLLGFTMMDLIDIGRIVVCAVVVPLLMVAVMVTGVFAVTWPAVTWN